MFPNWGNNRIHRLLFHPPDRISVKMQQQGRVHRVEWKPIRIVSVAKNSLFPVVNGDEWAKERKKEGGETAGKRTRFEAHVSEERLKIAHRFAEITSRTSCTVTQKTCALSLSSEQKRACNDTTSHHENMNGASLINRHAPSSFHDRLRNAHSVPVKIAICFCCLHIAKLIARFLVFRSRPPTTHGHRREKKI